MAKCEKAFDKEVRMRKRSGEQEEEQKGGSEGSQVSDEYHYPAGQSYVPIPHDEEGADFGPPIF